MKPNCIAAKSGVREAVIAIAANNRVERGAAMRFGLDGDGDQIAVIAVASALPASIAHLCH